MPPFICPHLDILLIFGPLSTKHIDKKGQGWAQGPKTLRGCRWCPEEWLGEWGWFSPGKRWPQRGPITWLPVCMRRSPRATRLFSSAWQAQHKLRVEMCSSLLPWENTSHEAVTQLAQIYCALSLLGRFQNSNGHSPEQLGSDLSASLVWDSLPPWATLWPPAVLSGLWKAKEGSAPGWGHLKNCPELGHSIALWNT